MKMKKPLIWVMAVVMTAGVVAWLRAETPTPAIVNLTCAPWDGSAFRVMVPLDNTTSARVVSVVIYRNAAIHQRITFTFPDATGKLGTATVESHAGKFEDMAGTVTFNGVEAGKAVTGVFDLATPAGEKIHRAFRADWGTERPLCG